MYVICKAKSNIHSNWISLAPLKVSKVVKYKTNYLYSINDNHSN